MARLLAALFLLVLTAVTAVPSAARADGVQVAHGDMATVDAHGPATDRAPTASAVPGPHGHGIGQPECPTAVGCDGIGGIDPEPVRVLPPSRIAIRQPRPTAVPPRTIDPPLEDRPPRQA